MADQINHQKVPSSYSTTAHYATKSPVHEIQPESAVILVSMQDTILSISPAAARLLGVSVEMCKGKPVSILGRALDAVSHHTTRPGSADVIQLENGHTVLARTRTVVGKHNQPMGRAVTLQDVTVPAEHRPSQQRESMPALGELETQIASMQELIDMIPQFSHHKYWQNLLLEHMQRLIHDMTKQVQELQVQDTSPLYA